MTEDIRVIKRFKSFGENNHAWNGGRFKRSDGYIMTRCVGHPRATKKGHYVLEHILVMEVYIGRYLKKGEEVHHINHIRDDNRIENLKLLSKSEHRRIHSTGKAYLLGRHKDTSDRQCFECGSKTTRMYMNKSCKTPCPRWYHLPTDKENWYCMECYMKYWGRNRTTRNRSQIG